MKKLKIIYKELRVVKSFDQMKILENEKFQIEIRKF